MDLKRRLLAGPGAQAFWTVVGIRVAFWIGTALTLLWQRPHFSARDRDLSLPIFQAYDGHTDLLFNTFTQWDSGWFLNIAQNGYGGEQAAAFFPLYPLLVHLLAWVTRSPVVAGVLISLVSAGLGAVAVARIAQSLLQARVARDGLLYLALWPVAFVFTAVYSDGLFLAFAAWAFWLGMQRRALPAGVLGALAVGTRLIGLALLPALLVLLWPREKRLPQLSVRLAPLALLPAALGLYAWYLQHRLGDWRDFYQAQGAFWLRHQSAAGPFGGLWEAAAQGYHGFAQVVIHLGRAAQVTLSDETGTRNALHLVLLAAALWLTWVAWRRLGTAAGVYSLAYLAIILSSPVSYFPLVSLPRFVLGDFPLFLALAAVTEQRPTARQIVLTGFAAVGGAAAVGFARHAWIA